MLRIRNEYYEENRSNLSYNPIVTRRRTPAPTFEKKKRKHMDRTIPLIRSPGYRRKRLESRVRRDRIIMSLSIRDLEYGDAYSEESRGFSEPEDIAKIDLNRDFGSKLPRRSVSEDPIFSGDGVLSESRTANPGFNSMENITFTLPNFSNTSIKDPEDVHEPS
jgi:hypothetical protein